GCMCRNSVLVQLPTSDDPPVNNRSVLSTTAVCRAIPERLSQYSLKVAYSARRGSSDNPIGGSPMEILNITGTPATQPEDPIIRELARREARLTRVSEALVLMGWFFMWIVPLA